MIKKIERDGDTFVMTVQLGEGATGYKEKWHYVREETSVGVSYIMIDREDTK